MDSRPGGIEEQVSRTIIEAAIDNLRDNWFSMLLQVGAMVAIVWFAVAEIRDVKRDVQAKIDESYANTTAFAAEQAQKLEGVTTELNEVTAALASIMGVTAEELTANRAEIVESITEGKDGAVEAGKSRFKAWLDDRKKDDEEGQ